MIIYNNNIIIIRIIIRILVLFSQVLLLYWFRVFEQVRKVVAQIESLNGM